MFKLENAVQDYAWGMKEWLPAFLDRENSENKPQAELWMGAHPKAPSKNAETGQALDGMIREKGTELLGQAVFEKYGRLPFLFKILAVEEPLSIQVHPSIAQAVEGFARENEKGIDLSAYNRNYRDDNHKPEIICAVETYTAMKGFRSFEEIKANFADLTGELDFDLFSGGTIGDFYFALMELGDDEKKSLLDKADKVVGNDLKGTWVRKLMSFYPGDVSALAPLFLNIIELQKGEALFLPAGELHAYLSGVGIELMANSDNVLRGGLTPKYVDLDELRKVVKFEHSPVTVLNKERDDLYFSGADEFVLGEKEVDGDYVLDCRGEAGIILVFSGNMSMVSGDKDLSGRKGEVLFVEAGDEPVAIKGKGKVYWATVKKEG